MATASGDTRLIWTSTALGGTALFGAFTVAPLIARDLTGSSAWSGIPGAASVAGTAIGALVLSAVMRARGRPAGLRLGYAIGVVGAVVAAVATGARAFWALLLGMILVGVAHASNQLARFAAADLHPPEARPAVVGWIVWSLTVGAAAGPTLPGVSEPLVTGLGLPADAAGFVLAVVFLAGALTVSVLLRARPFDEEAPAGSRTASFGELLRLIHVRLALLVMLTGQATMVLVMTITPLHVRAGGHDLSVVGLVMGSHFVGMYALAPVAGRLVARIGTRATIVAGLTVLAVGAGGAGSTTGAHGGPVAAWLFLLGLGWSMSFVAASAMLTQGLDLRSRVTAQGGVDAVTWTVSAIASASSGLMLERFGFDVLAFAAAVLVVPAVVALVVVRRTTTSPARA